LVDGHWVFGMIERNSNKYRLEICPDNKRDEKTLLKLLEKHVEAGTTIYSDLWRGYINLGQHGYYHGTVNHSYNFVDPTSGVHTNTIESNWRPLKNRIERGGVGKDGNFGHHLCEYLWIRSHKADDDIFMSFIKAIADVYDIK